MKFVYTLTQQPEGQLQIIMTMKDNKCTKSTYDLNKLITRTYYKIKKITEIDLT